MSQLFVILVLLWLGRRLLLGITALLGHWWRLGERAWRYCLVEWPRRRRDARAVERLIAESCDVEPHDVR